MASAWVSQFDHHRAVTRISHDLAAWPDGVPVRLAKRTSNLFRPRESSGTRLDVQGLDRVLDVDTQAGTATVQGMCTYQTLVSATHALGVMPLVVPQLRTITLGGAITGLGIESTSFRSGLPHESVREMDVLLASGDVVTARPTGEHADLFRAFPNSYGALGYITRAVIDIEPIAPYVRVHHERCASPAAAVDRLAAIAAERDGRPDFLDGVVFDAQTAVVTSGYFDDAPRTRASDYTGQQIYYRSLLERTEDLLTTRGYLWRWDTDWFWCSRAFGAQQPIIRRLWPRRARHSEVYARLIRYDDHFGFTRRAQDLTGRPHREKVIQDIEMPVGHAAAAIDWLLEHVGITPMWLCPLRLRASGEQPWPLYPLEGGVDYINIGVWGTVPVKPGAGAHDVNIDLERALPSWQGHKSLYSEVFLDRDEFGRRYGGAEYRRVKARYDPEGRLPQMYDKVVTR